MNTDIFIVTCARHASFLDYALQSIARNCNGFRRTVVLCPTQDVATVEMVMLKHKHALMVLADEYGDGHNWQMLGKMNADLHTDADMILISDSDTLFVRPTTPESFMWDGKPLHLMQRYDHPEIATGHNGLPVPWRVITERDCGWPVDYEYMRRQGFMYPRWLFKEARDHLEKMHGCPADVWIMGRSKPIPPAFRSFCEFNFLNAYAHKKHPDKFCFLEVGKDTIPQGPLWQGWSHDINHPHNTDALKQFAANKAVTQPTITGL